MSSGYGDLTVQAHRLVTTGDLAAAHELLADALADADPRPAHASPELADAAGLYARVLLTLGEPRSARSWAAFAHSATTRLHGPADPRTIAGAATLAAVLHRLGDHARAARLYRDVIIELTATDGPESLRVLAAHADLATVEYARGGCTTARNRLQDAWELHREVYGDGHLSGIKMLARLGAMQRDCGQFTEAHDNLALARDLCRRYLSADDPLALQVTALARAAADPDHVCGDDPAEGPGDSPADDAADEPGGSATDQAADWPADAGHGEPAAPAPAPVPVPPRTVADAAGFVPLAAGRGTRDAGVPVVPAPRLPPETTATAQGGGFDHDAVEDDRWWSRRESTTGTEDGTDAPPLPPAVPEFVGAERSTAHGDDPDDYRRVRYLPERRADRLPVPIHRPPRRPPSRMVPIVIAGVAVVGLGTAAVVVGVASVDGSAPGGTTPTRGATVATPAAASTAPAPASPGAPPTGITLRDNRDSVTLTWTYPATASGPVVVSGGRAGEDPRVLQQLPPGTGRHVVRRLERTADYCFTVAVVYSTEIVGRSKPVCTTRQRR